MRIADCLISARFLSTFGHFTALLILFQTVDNNVEKSFADGAVTEKDSAMLSANWALAFGCICFFFDFMGIFSGNSLFIPGVNVFQVFFHAIGSILLSWLITQNWEITKLWPIVLCTNLPTALMEWVVIIGIYGFKIGAR
jgi:hypothetical protein